MATFLDIAGNIHNGIEKRDSTAVTQALTTCNHDQLLNVGKMYKDAHKKEMHLAIRESFPDAAGSFIADLAAPRVFFIAHNLHGSLTANPADEAAVADLLGHISNDDITKVNAEYANIYNANVIDHVGSGNPEFRKILEDLLQGKRVEHLPVDIKGNRVAEAVEKLHNDGEAKKGNIADFTHFFVESPFAHIRNVDKLYTQKYKHGLGQVAKDLLSGPILMLVLASVLPRAEYWTHRIHNSLKHDKGTDNATLERAFTLNSESELTSINATYKKMYEGPSIGVDIPYHADKTLQPIFERLCLRINLL